MILSFVFHIFKTVMSYAIRLLAWLLVSLSLWVPLVYTVIFVIAVGFAGGSLTELKNWYLFGLALSFIGSFAVSAFIYERGVKNKKKAKSKVNLSKVSEKQDGMGLTKRDSFLPEQPLSVQQGAVQDFQNKQSLQDSEGQQMVEGRYNQTDSNKKGSEHYQSGVQGGYVKDGQNGLQGGYDRQRHYSDVGFTKSDHDYQSGLKNNYSQSQANPQQGYEAGFQSGFTAGFKGGQTYKSETAAKHGFFAYNALNTEYNSSEYGLNKDSYDMQNNGDTNNFGKSRLDFGENNMRSRDYSTSEAAGFAASELVSAASGSMQNGYDEYGASFSSPVSAGINVGESPTIFATRNDPTVFIYEYSDRLEYYKRTRSGMILMNTKTKTG